MSSKHTHRTISKIHATAAASALLLVTFFWTSTIVSELLLSVSAMISVKHWIATYGLACMVASMAAAGVTGVLIGRGRDGRWVKEKKKRMPWIAMNGIAIMIPSALYLNFKAASGQFDLWFYAVQLLELVVGLIQLDLLLTNFVAGLRLAGRMQAKQDRVGPSSR